MCSLYGGTGSLEKFALWGLGGAASGIHRTFSLEGCLVQQQGRFGRRKLVPWTSATKRGEVYLLVRYPIHALVGYYKYT